jgi:hypothetical protein
MAGPRSRLPAGARIHVLFEHPRLLVGVPLPPRPGGRSTVPRRLRAQGRATVRPLFRALFGVGARAGWRPAAGLRTRRSAARRGRTAWLVRTRLAQHPGAPSGDAAPSARQPGHTRPVGRDRLASSPCRGLALPAPCRGGFATRPPAPCRGGFATRPPAPCRGRFAARGGPPAARLGPRALGHALAISFGGAGALVRPSPGTASLASVKLPWFSGLRRRILGARPVARAIHRHAARPRDPCAPVGSAVGLRPRTFWASVPRHGGIVPSLEGPASAHVGVPELCPCCVCDCEGEVSARGSSQNVNVSVICRRC